MIDEQIIRDKAITLDELMELLKKNEKLFTKYEIRLSYDMQCNLPLTIVEMEFVGHITEKNDSIS